MVKHDIVVIGASAGALEPPLQAVAAGLPNSFAAALFVVQHIGSGPSVLPKLLASAGPLPALFPSDGETIRPGRIYVAPPDRQSGLDIRPGPLTFCLPRALRRVARR